MADPRGSLVAVGGNEDKTSDKEILRRIVDLPKGGAKHVEIIPTASTVARSVSDDYIDAFRDLKVPKVGVLDIRERREADHEDHVERIHKADVIYLTGGDQLRLTTVLGGSPVLDAIVERYKEGGVIAGTSAGAAAMSSTMISGGDDGSMRKGSVRMSPGFGLIKSCIVDTHFLDRGRVARLLEVVASNPGHIGLGVGENTGILVREGHMVEVIGSGIVVVVDGTAMHSTNLTSIKPSEPIAVEGVLVHTLAPGYRYDLKDKKYLQPEKSRERTKETREKEKSNQKER
ncbi:MAG TPA: cyanophycinase [Candidatus Thermoplasmatota archaeon]|nr:cyanophycinase [Candidatus Thermoplasmatota archaeon]